MSEEQEVLGAFDNLPKPSGDTPSLTTEALIRAKRFLDENYDAEAAWTRLVERLAAVGKTPEDLLAVMEGVAFIVEQDPLDA